MAKSPKKSPTRTPLKRVLRPRKPTKALIELMRHAPVWGPLTAQAENDRLVQQPGAKPGNPKDALGILKVPASTLSAPVTAEVGVAMFEGALKYGRHNY